MQFAASNVVVQPKETRESQEESNLTADVEIVAVVDVDQISETAEGTV